jgi:dimethylhistidine N-methyltransferase
MTDTISAPVVNSRFFKEVIDGLSRPQKQLPSKYFYDAKGDVLFQEIMNSDEYYLSRSEMEIFSDRTDRFVSLQRGKFERFLLVELGPGDVSKSIHLLSALYSERIKFDYIPIDISASTINFLSSTLPGCFDGLSIRPMNGEYFDMLRSVQETDPETPKVVLCLGGNIANMLPPETEAFCAQLRAVMKPGDMAIIGFDLKKNPRIIRTAYDDKKGITAAFNLNLLTRMNRELGANFNIKKFEHYCEYDPETGSCKSYLVCLEDMKVEIGHAKVFLKKDECVLMEISQKYSCDQIETMAKATGFRVTENVFDNKRWFVDSVWTAG